MASVWKSEGVTQQYLNGVRGAIPLAAEQIDVVLRLIHAGGRTILRVLDLGCGDGVLAAAILAEHTQAHADLIDFSRPMIDAARARFAGSGRSVSFAVRDYSAPGWLDAAPYEVIVSGFSIHHQSDERKRSLYAELHDLLTPGGLFLNIEHVSSPSPWIEAVHDNLFIDHLHACDASRSRAEIAASYRARTDKAENILAPVDTQCAWLREIGFEDVDCYLKIFELAVFGGRRRA